MEKKVCVIQTDFQQHQPIIAIHSKPLAHVHPLQAEIKDRDELKKAIEQSDRLLSRIQQLEEENAELSKEKHEAFNRIRDIQWILCVSVVSIVLFILCVESLSTYSHRKRQLGKCVCLLRDPAITSKDVEQSPIHHNTAMGELD